MGIDGRQSTKQKGRIFHIGLGKREVLVIRSLFRLAPELNEKFVFGPPLDGDEVDIVFVNGDNTESLRDLDTLRKEREDVIPILVVSDDREIPGLPMVKKPLAFKKFMQILEAITAAEASVVMESVGRDIKHARVLVVDDSFPARRYMKFKIEELARGLVNVTVDFAETGEVAVHAAESNRYDVAFLDVVLPGMDGYETCKRIKQVSNLHAVMLTGQKAAINRMRAKLAGCNEYLTKPPPDDELKRIFTELAARLEQAVA